MLVLVLVLVRGGRLYSARANGAWNWTSMRSMGRALARRRPKGGGRLQRWRSFFGGAACTDARSSTALSDPEAGLPWTRGVAP